MQAKISIVMPMKNPGQYLPACLDSIIAQSYKNWELVCIDDGSTDNSAEVVRHYALNDKRITIYKSKGKGIVDALKQGYSLCTGEFIHRMDSDDLMPNNKLETLLQRWQPNSVVTGKVKYFSDDWEVGDGFVNYQNWINGLMNSENFWKDVYMECPIPSPGWLMKRTDFDRIGGFNCVLMPEDYDLCFRIYKAGIDVVGCDEVIHLWRDSPSRVSRNEEVYFPMAYYPLKVKYFLDIDRRQEVALTLSGAGKKGKRIAELLIEHGIAFEWITNNPKKIGQNIYGQVIRDWREVVFKNNQVIFAVSSPESKLEIRKELEHLGIHDSLDYYWFC